MAALIAEAFAALVGLQVEDDLIDAPGAVSCGSVAWRRRRVLWRSVGRVLG